MYEASTKCRFTKNIKVNESCEVLRYVAKKTVMKIFLLIWMKMWMFVPTPIFHVPMLNLQIIQHFSKVKYQLLEEGASARLRLASLSKELEHKHYEMTLEHLAPHTYGDMDNYGIVKSKSKFID